MLCPQACVNFSFRYWKWFWSPILLSLLLLLLLYISHSTGWKVIELTQMYAYVVTSVLRKFSSVSTRLDLGVKSTCLQSVIQNWSTSRLRWKIFSMSPDMSGPCLVWKTNMININPVQDISSCVLLRIIIWSLVQLKSTLPHWWTCL